MVREGDQLMAEALGAGQEEVHSKLSKVGKRSSCSQRKHQTSPVYLRKAPAQEIMMALRLAKSIREGDKVTWLIARRLKIKGLGIKLHGLPADGEGLGVKGWREYASVLEKRAKGLRSELHCDLRQQMKRQRIGRGVRLTMMMEPATEEGGGREGAALTNAQRKRRNGAVDSAVIREETEKAEGPPGVRAATSEEEVKTSTLEYMKKMGWRRSFRFHSPDGVAPDQSMGGVLWLESGGHSIYQDSEQGREFRKRLVEGKLTAEDTNTIPECFHRMLKHLERKKTVRGDLITSEDHSEAGLLKPITSQKWRQFWARAREGKRGGESELHATLIKAAVKNVFIQTGPDGKSKKAAYTEHVVEGLRQLVNASREGRFFYRDRT